MASQKESSAPSTPINNVQASLEELVSIITRLKDNEDLDLNPSPTANCSQLMWAYLHLELKSENSMTVVRNSHPSIHSGVTTFSYIIYMVKLCSEDHEEYWIVPYHKDTIYGIDQYIPDEYMIKEFKKKNLL